MGTIASMGCQRSGETTPTIRYSDAQGATSSASYFCGSLSIRKKCENFPLYDILHNVVYRYSGGNWLGSLVIGGHRNWEFRVRGNLTYREDTGLINRSPVVNIPPLIQLQYGCSHTIKIAGIIMIASTTASTSNIMHAHCY